MGNCSSAVAAEAAPEIKQATITSSKVGERSVVVKGVETTVSGSGERLTEDAATIAIGKSLVSVLHDPVSAGESWGTGGNGKGDDARMGLMLGSGLLREGGNRAPCV